VLVTPLRTGTSRSGTIVSLATLPWALLVVLGAGAISSGFGVSVPRTPFAVRVIVVAIALTPSAIILLRLALGPVRGFRWLDPPPISLLVDERELVFEVDGTPRWSVPWGLVDRLEALDNPERLGIHRRDDPTLLELPARMLSGRIAGISDVIDVIDLIESQLSNQRNLTT
jgi:hypothetical protein